jgi:hypothetical protein
MFSGRSSLSSSSASSIATSPNVLLYKSQSCTSTGARGLFSACDAFSGTCSTVSIKWVDVCSRVCISEEVLNCYWLFQSLVCYFFIIYAYYFTPTARQDGYDADIYEMSTVMAISAVYVTSAYAALNNYAHTWWMLFAVLIGPVLIILYTVVYSAIKPGWIWTFVYGA